jgi:serine protease Do
MQNFPNIFNSKGLARQVGSGLIISSNGLIVSSAHLVRGARKIQVRLHSGKTLPAHLLGADRDMDIALLKIKLTKPIAPPAIAFIESVTVGQPVFAIGAPFGFEGSVTAGIVSAIRKHTRLLKKTDVIQTDVAVNPGNSGGPLFNYDGAVIGITSQIMSTNGGYQGISFAVSMDSVNTALKTINRSMAIEPSENR